MVEPSSRQAGAPRGPLPALAPAVTAPPSPPAGRCPSRLCLPCTVPPLPYPTERLLAGSVCRLPDVEMWLVSHPEGHVPPCLPSIGAGSSLNWRGGGSSHRARTCRAGVPFARGGAAAIYHRRFPKPLTLLLLFPLFTLPPACPAPWRKCGYGPPGRLRRQRQKGGKEPRPWHRHLLLQGRMLGPHSLLTVPRPQPLRAPSPPSAGPRHPPRLDRRRRGVAVVPTCAGLAGADAFLPQPSAPIPAIVSRAGVGGQSRGPPLAVGGTAGCRRSCRFPA